MADTPQHSLLAEGLSQGQGPDIFELARATRGRAPAAEEGERQPTRTIVPGTGVAAIDIFTRKSRREEQADINTRNAMQQANDFINASGVDVSKLSEQEVSGLQGLALSNPQAFAQQIQQVELSQGLNLSAAQHAQARRSSVDLRIADEQLIQAGIKTKMDRLTFNQAAGFAPDRDLLVSTAKDLRGERTKDLAPYNDSLRTFDDLVAVLDLDSGPASMAVLFKFIKSMDDSVVRASEVELLTSASGPVRALVDQWNRIQAGGVFGPETKAEILEVAQGIAETQFNAAKRINDNHDRLAARFAERFGMPSVIELSQSAAFDPNRTFAPAPGCRSTAPHPPVDDMSNMEPPPGFTR